MNLTIVILDFGVRLYGGSKLSLDMCTVALKHLSKCLLQMQKMLKKKRKEKKEIKPEPNFLLMDNNFGGSV